MKKTIYKIGDIYCDCRCKHLKIVKIITGKRCNKFIRWLASLWFVPLNFGFYIKEKCAWVEYQNTLILEDGAHCGMACGELAKDDNSCHTCGHCNDPKCSYDCEAAVKALEEFYGRS